MCSVIMGEGLKPLLLIFTPFVSTWRDLMAWGQMCLPSIDPSGANALQPHVPRLPSSRPGPQR